MKRKRTTWMCLASTLLAVAWVQAPSTAAVPTPSPGCTALNNPARDGRYRDANTDGFGIGALSITPLARGETVIVTTTSPDAGLTRTGMEFFDFAVSYGPIVQVIGSTPGTVSYTLAADWDGSQQSLGWGVGSSSGLATFDVACRSAAADGTSEGSGELPMAPLQQFSRAESQMCDRQPDDLQDFPALGAQRHLTWSRSWAQWPNGGTGGFVCTRQPYFTAAGGWAVG